MPPSLFVLGYATFDVSLGESLNGFISAHLHPHLHIPGVLQSQFLVEDIDSLDYHVFDLLPHFDAVFNGVFDRVVEGRKTHREVLPCVELLDFLGETGQVEGIYVFDKKLGLENTWDVKVWVEVGRDEAI